MAGGDRAECLGQGKVPGQCVAGEVGMPAPPVVLVQHGRAGRCERSAEQTRRHRAVDDRACGVCSAPGEHVDGVAVDQVETWLHGVHVPDGLGRVELRDVVVGQPDGPDLAFPSEVAEGLPVLLELAVVLTAVTGRLE